MRGKYKYLIKWKGWGNKHNVWKTEFQLRHSLKLIDQYWARHNHHKDRPVRQRDGKPAEDAHRLGNGEIAEGANDDGADLSPDADALEPEPRVRRKRGRPRKNPLPTTKATKTSENAESAEPPKNAISAEKDNLQQTTEPSAPDHPGPGALLDASPAPIPRKRGRPRKTPAPERSTAATDDSAVAAILRRGKRMGIN